MIEKLVAECGQQCNLNTDPKPNSDDCKNSDYDLTCVLNAAIYTSGDDCKHVGDDHWQWRLHTYDDAVNKFEKYCDNTLSTAASPPHQSDTMQAALTWNWASYFA